MANTMTERFPVDFAPDPSYVVGVPMIRPRFADLRDGRWECTIDGCDFDLAETDDQDTDGGRFMWHAVTKHPQATAEATGKNVEELAKRYEEWRP